VVDSVILDLAAQVVDLVTQDLVAQAVAAVDLVNPVLVGQVVEILVQDGLVLAVRLDLGIQVHAVQAVLAASVTGTLDLATSFPPELGNNNLQMQQY
jgi:hypothetical protein